MNLYKDGLATVDQKVPQRNGKRNCCHRHGARTMKAIFHSLAFFLPLAVTVQSSSWLEECRSKGFDPWQLACETCSLLSLPNNQETCLSCCQSYKDSRILIKPYQSAKLFIYRASPELQDLWQDAQVPKRLEVVEDSSARSPWGPFAKLVFYDNGEPSETVHLDSAWKKEDIRDMILALLV